MKRQGTTCKYSDEVIMAAIKLYETSDLGWQEVADKVNIPKSTILARRRKLQRSDATWPKENNSLTSNP